MRPTRIGGLIAALRLERGLTQADLASRVGVTRNTISRWETGETGPALAMLGPLCRALGGRPEIFVEMPRRSLERWFVE